MLVQNAIDIIRARVNDTEAQIFTDTELIHYLNLTIGAVAKQAIREGNPLFIKRASVAADTGLAVPNDFHSLCPGETCYVADGKLNLDEAISGTKTVRYFATPVRVDAAADTIPLTDSYADSAVNGALELAAMRIGKDVNQERQSNMMMTNVSVAHQEELGSFGGGGSFSPLSGGGGGGMAPRRPE